MVLGDRGSIAPIRPSTRPATGSARPIPTNRLGLGGLCRFGPSPAGHAASSNRSGRELETSTSSQPRRHRSFADSGCALTTRRVQDERRQLSAPSAHCVRLTSMRLF